MSNIGKDTISISDFYDNHFLPNPRYIIFWDTCSLLDILRFPFRGGTLDRLKKILFIKELIINNNLISVCSSLTQIEWNEHEAKVKGELARDLRLTSDYHNCSLDMINYFSRSEFEHVAIYDKGLEDGFENLADEILENSFFFETEEISDNALWRVANKRPPSSKKQEFKDCAIWESALFLGGLINENKKVLFYTVNKDDFIDKSKTPNIPYSSIVTEAVSKGIDFSIDIDECYGFIEQYGLCEL